jgi:tRNA(Ile)-lysidine synthase
MDPFERAVLETITRHRLLTPGAGAVAAVSGGADSVALLLALLALRDALKLKLCAAHLNHLLRGPESDQDEEFVRTLCETHGVELTVRRIETRAGAAQSRRNLEDHARRVRYDFLLETAERRNAIVATGHTLNDLAETFLLKLFRGAGLTGLAGIYPRRENRRPDGSIVPVIRPLIETARPEILEYLARRRQGFREDSSNLDLDLDRNQVRRQLIPLLEARFNPGVVRVIGRTATLLRELEELTTPLVDAAFERCHDKKEPGLAVVISSLLKEAPVMQRAIVRRAIKQDKGDLKDVSFKHVEDVLKLAMAESGSECHLPGRRVALREFDRLAFIAASSASDFCYELAPPGDVYIEEVGKRVIVRRVVSGEAGRGVRLNLTSPRLRLRKRRPGDTYRTRLDRSPRKLKEVLIEQRIPKSHRDRLVVIDDGVEIVWVEGMRPNPRFTGENGAGEAFEIQIRPETFRPDGLLTE